MQRSQDAVTRVLNPRGTASDLAKRLQALAGLETHIDITLDSAQAALLFEEFPAACVVGVEDGYLYADGLLTARIFVRE